MRKSENEKLAIVWYKECVPFSDEVDYALRCLYLQGATRGSGENRHNIEKGRKDKTAVAASE